MPQPRLLLPKQKLLLPLKKLPPPTERPPSKPRLPSNDTYSCFVHKLCAQTMLHTNSNAADATISLHSDGTELSNVLIGH